MYFPPVDWVPQDFIAPSLYLMLADCRVTQSFHFLLKDTQWNHEILLTWPLSWLFRPAFSSLGRLISKRGKSGHTVCVDKDWISLIWAREENALDHPLSLQNDCMCKMGISWSNALRSAEEVHSRSKDVSSCECLGLEFPAHHSPCPSLTAPATSREATRTH